MDDVWFQSYLEEGSHRGQLPQSHSSRAYSDEGLMIPEGYMTAEELMAGNETNHSRKAVPDYPDEDAVLAIRPRFARYLHDCVLELQITDQASLDLLTRALPDVLETFALRLFHSDPPTPGASEFARVLHDERRSIVSLFTELSATRTTEDELPRRAIRIRSTDDGKRRGEGERRDRRDRWLKRAKRDKESPSALPLVLTVPLWRDWLKEMMRRSIYFEYLDPNSAISFRNDILEYLSLHAAFPARPSIFSRVLRVVAEFVVHWDPRLVMMEWGKDEVDIATILGRTITLTGSKDVQAATCEQYVLQRWPETGKQALDSITKAVKDWSPDPTSRMVNEYFSTQHDEHLSLGCRFTDKEELLIRAIGPPYFVSELSEQIGWIVSALQNSPYLSQIATVRPVLQIQEPPSHRPAPPGDRSRHVVLHANIGFVTDRYVYGYPSGNGKCWQRLFNNPVVVYGYPVRTRPQLEPGTGLEIPLDVLMALVDSNRIETFNKKNLIKGFSAILIPTQKVQDIVLWHMWYNRNGERISYTDARIGEFEHVSEAELNSSRHIVGWCSRAWNHTGSPDANYDIGWSGLGRPPDRHVWEKVVISAGLENITVSTSFVLSKKDKSILSSPRQGYQSRLNFMSKQYVLLYDVLDHRAWLVDGLSALLHLVRASLRSDKSATPGILGRRGYQIIEADHSLQGPEEAAAVLMDTDNCATRLYFEEEELLEEIETYKSDGETEVVFSKMRRKYYCFKDRVLDIYSIMEKIVDHLNDQRSENGVGFRFRGTPRNLLQGFDFQDLATRDTPLKPHAVKLKLHNSGRGWTDLARSLQAITLFGKGFGDLITPDDPLTAQSCDGCGFGTTLPKNKEYMGVCVLLPAKTPKLWGRVFKNPSSLETAGAVYFCNSRKFPLRHSHQTKTQSEPQDTNGRAQTDGAAKVATALSTLHLDKSHKKQAGAHAGLKGAKC